MAPAANALTSRHLLGSAKVRALANGTLCRATRSEREFPNVPAVGTLERSHFSHFYDSSFDSEGHALDQCSGHLLPGRLDNPPDGLSGDAHLFGGLFLIKPLVVGQPQRLVFVHREFDFTQRSPRHARWLEKGEVRQGGDSSAAFRSGHFSTSS
jgi:hypothetical protein